MTFTLFDMPETSLVIRIIWWRARLSRTRHRLVITWWCHVDTCRVHSHTRFRSIRGGTALRRRVIRREAWWRSRNGLYYRRIPSRFSFFSAAFLAFYRYKDNDDDRNCHPNNNTTDGPTRQAIFITVVIVVIIGVAWNSSASGRPCT